MRDSYNNTLVYFFMLIIAFFACVSCHDENVQHLENRESVHSHTGDTEHAHPHPAEAEHQDSSPVAMPSRPPQAIMKNISVISVYTFDPGKGETGSISYDLLEPARTRIVITAKDDPDQLYRVLFWDWQGAGKQQIEWDGTDQSGYPLDRMTCAVRTNAIAKSVHQPGTKVVKPLTTEQLVQGLQGPPDHSVCDPEKCKPMEVRFVSIGGKSDAGTPLNKKLSHGAVLSGVVAIEAEVAKDARGYGNMTGYGVRWMVDQQLVAAQYYEKESDGKFRWALDTTAFRDGEHVLRVSTCDHYDHIGLVGTKVIFANQ